MYALVDIETTGGQPSGNSITEIAILISDGERIVDGFQTLVNPGAPIPPYIQAFTGITNQMVEDAPVFPEIAQRVYDLLSNNIFVAHNVNFDYSFIKHQLEACGLTLNAKKLCTVRLSRKVFPGYRSYSLGNICASLGIRLHDRHRAGGDVQATAELFHNILREDKEGIVAESLKKGAREYVLPPNIPKEQADKLPTGAGVYYFVDERGLALYVGKAKNLKSRVYGHFSGTLKSAQKQNFLRAIHGLSFTPTGSELLALLLESHEIRRLWPDENKAQKRVSQVFGLFDYLDQNGKIRFGIDKVRGGVKPLLVFSNRLSAMQYLDKMVDMFQLCPKLCNQQTNPGPCIAIEKEVCGGECQVKENKEAYNAKAQAFFDSLNQEKRIYFIVGKGRTNKEKSVIIYEPGRILSYTFLPSRQQLDFELVREQANHLKLNPVMESILAPVISGEQQKDYKVFTQTQFNFSVNG